jgi:hypothetical protein
MDSHFISGEYFEVSLPKERAYLQRYFATDVQRAFLKYMHVFGDWKLFIEHTGHYCSKRTLQLLDQKLRKLEEAHKVAKGSMDFDTLELIESGRYRNF